MIGGRLIEMSKVGPGIRLWVTGSGRDGDSERFDECCVHVEDGPEVRSLKLGEEIWWQAGKVYARGETLVMRKIANSYDPRRGEA